MPRRRASSQRGIIVLFVTILLVIYGVFSALTGTSININIGATSTPSFPATATTFQPNITPTSGPAWWQVYFTDPLTINDPNNYAASIEGKLIEQINAAQSSIHIASFEFDLNPVAEALIAARQRGVDVRWVTDNEYGLVADTEPGHGQFAMLQNAGIEVRGDNRTALMHNKFWIFDGKILWTGSTNITKNGIFIQDNNAIVFSSPELAAIYEREFEEMWNGQFGPKSPSQLNEQSLVLNGTPIQVIFTSEDPALETAIIPLVRSATSSIRFLAFSFTDYPLAEAMIQRAQQGVNVAGVIDKTQSGGQGSELATLFCAKIPVRQDGNRQFMHNKVIIIDERYVITGSLNFSTSAEESNDENVIIIDNPDIARRYMQDFERVYGQGAAPDPSKVTCP
ncbi:MAG TPA: phospholipase D-like domain-containing protein [Anaerolineales bacterium]|nr:phospholipase D-like domain-containing protein [Anaerolineales bacterium]